MTSTLIRDTFTYFARFPALAGVLKNFTKDTSGSYAGYDILKTVITALSPNSLIVGLDDYVFGADIFSIKKRIEQFSGIYLFIDYGNISDSLQEPYRTEQADFVIAVTVARKIHLNDIDQIEQVLLADKTLAMISEIKDITKADKRSSAFTQQMIFPAEISPWFAADLFDSTGWTMSFRIRGVHLI